MSGASLSPPRVYVVSVSQPVISRSLSALTPPPGLAVRFLHAVLMFLCNRNIGYPIEEVSLSSAITHAVTPLGFGLVSGLIIVGISGDFYIVCIEPSLEVIRRSEGSRPYKGSASSRKLGSSEYTRAEPRAAIDREY